MVRAISTQSNHTAADKIAPKRHFRSKIPLKPKGPAIGERKLQASPRGLSARLNGFSSIPRIMRARIERASEPKPARKVADDTLAGESHAGHQPLARSSSGKVALGPWSGPFGSGSLSDDDALVLYLDVSGHAHETLNDVPNTFDANPRTRRDDPKKSLDASLKKSVQVLSASSPKVGGYLKVHEMEILAMQSRALMMNCKNTHKGKRGYSRNRGMGVINQPRKC